MMIEDVTGWRCNFNLQKLKVWLTHRLIVNIVIIHISNLEHSLFRTGYVAGCLLRQDHHHHNQHYHYHYHYHQQHHHPHNHHDHDHH